MGLPNRDELEGKFDRAKGATKETVGRAPRRCDGRRRLLGPSGSALGLSQPVALVDVLAPKVWPEAVRTQLSPVQHESS